MTISHANRYATKRYRMGLVDTLAWLNATFGVIYAVMIGMKGFFLWRFLKKEKIGIWLDEHGNTVGKKRIKAKLSTISFKDGTYNTTGEGIKYGKKRLLLYYIGNPDPVRIREGMVKSVFEPKTYEDILKNDLVQKWMKPQGMFSGLDGKKILVFAGLAIVAIILYKGLLG